MKLNGSRMLCCLAESQTWPVFFVLLHDLLVLHHRRLEWIWTKSLYLEKRPLGHDRGSLRGPENPLRRDAITKYAKNVLGCYCCPLFCPLEWIAQKTKIDSFVKKVTFCFLTKSEKCDWVIGQKWSKNSLSPKNWIYLTCL